MGFFVCSLLLAVYYINSVTGFIDEKPASFHSLDIYRGEGFSNSFVLQFVLLYPSFYYFGFEYSAHAMNIALHSITIMLVLRYILAGAPKYYALLLLIYPAYVHYPITGLRDPLISLITVVLCVCAGRVSFAKFLRIAVLAAIVSLFVRVEFSVIILGLCLLRFYLVSGRQVRRRILVMCPPLVYLVMMFLPLAFGVENTGSFSGNVEIIARFNYLRYERGFSGDGATSHILGGDLYSLPLVVRYPIQVAASFIAPLPHELRGGFFLLAFVESIVFTSAVCFSFKKRKTHQLCEFVFWSGMVYMLLQAVFAINYGNLLRVRYPCYIFFVSCIAYSYVPQTYRFAGAQALLKIKRRENIERQIV